MTKVYFVRHAEPDYKNHNDSLRELSPKGMEDRKLVTGFLHDQRIDVVLSSPYRRAIDTISDFARKHGMEVIIEEAFRERKVDVGWIESFDTFIKMQWNDFDYKLPDGESLHEVQNRCVAALEAVLQKYPGNNIVIGSHGTAISTVIHYYDSSFGYRDFEKIKNVMPWIVEFDFDEQANCKEIKQYDPNR